MLPNHSTYLHLAKTHRVINAFPSPRYFKNIRYPGSHFSSIIAAKSLNISPSRENTLIYQCISIPSLSQKYSLSRIAFWILICCKIAQTIYFTRKHTELSMHFHLPVMQVIFSLPHHMLLSVHHVRDMHWLSPSSLSTCCSRPSYGAAPGGPLCSWKESLISVMLEQ